MPRTGWTLGTLLAVAAIVAIFSIPAIPYGPLDRDEAERLLDRSLRVEGQIYGEAARVDVVLAEGLWAGVPLAALDSARVIDCPVRSQVSGSLPRNALQRLGDGQRRYRETTYNCLFEAVDPAGLPLHVGMFVTRSADPELGEMGGYETQLQSWRGTDDLMREIGVVPADVPLADRAERDGLLKGAGFLLRDRAP